jgi:hypothetical protein
MRIAIASFLKFRVWLGAIFILAIIPAVCWLTVSILQNWTTSLPANHIFQVFCLAGMWVSLPQTFPPLISILKRLILEKGQAVWIEQGVLSTWLFSIPCGDIISVSSGELKLSAFVRKAAVILDLRDGGQKKLPVGSLLETSEVIIDRLNAVLKASIA